MREVTTIAPVSILGCITSSLFRSFALARHPCAVDLYREQQLRVLIWCCKELDTLQSTLRRFSSVKNIFADLLTSLLPFP